MNKIKGVLVQTISKLAKHGAAQQQQTSAPITEKQQAASSAGKQQEPAADQAAMSRTLSKEDVKATISQIQGKGITYEQGAELPKGASNDNGGGSAHRAVYHDKPLPEGVQPPNLPDRTRGRGRGR